MQSPLLVVAAEPRPVAVESRLDLAVETCCWTAAVGLEEAENLVLEEEGSHSWYCATNNSAKAFSFDSVVVAMVCGCASSMPFVRRFEPFDSIGNDCSPPFILEMTRRSVAQKDII